MNFKPLKNLLVIDIEMEETRNGFVVPDQYQEPNFGIVRAVGEGKKTKNGFTIPIPLNVGDKVMVSPMGGRREVEFDGKTCWLIDCDNILGVME